jgi:hypothetical protein
MKQSFQKYDVESEEAALRRVLRASGNLAFVPLGAAMAGSSLLSARARTRLWNAFVLTHLVHASALLALRQRHRRSGNAFSLVSKVVGPVGYAAMATLALADLVPGLPPKQGWRRSLQRAGHNALLGIYAVTISHGYRTKGRRAEIYGPLAALWVAAAVGMDRAWRVD